MDGNQEIKAAEDAEEFVRLLEDDGTWSEFEADWRSQCEKLDEDFDGGEYASYCKGL